MSTRFDVTVNVIVEEILTGCGSLQQTLECYVAMKQTARKAPSLNAIKMEHGERWSSLNNIQSTNQHSTPSDMYTLEIGRESPGFDRWKYQSYHRGRCQLHCLFPVTGKKQPAPFGSEPPSQKPPSRHRNNHVRIIRNCLHWWVPDNSSLFI